MSSNEEKCKKCDFYKQIIRKDSTELKRNIEYLKRENGRIEKTKTFSS